MVRKNVELIEQARRKTRLKNWVGETEKESFLKQKMYRPISGFMLKIAIVGYIWKLGDQIVTMIVIIKQEANRIIRLNYSLHFSCSDAIQGLCGFNSWE